MERIVFFGDSLTDMGRCRTCGDAQPYALGTGFVALVAAELSLKNPSGYEIINRGDSGNRITQLYARIKKDVWDFNPNVLNILIGTNDNNHELNDNGVELSRWEKIYRAIIEETQERLPKTKIILCAPYVIRGTRTAEEYEREMGVRPYAKKAEELAREYGLTFIDFQKPFDEFIAIYGDSALCYDNCHPSIVGSAIMAKEWLKTFREGK